MTGLARRHDPPSSHEAERLIEPVAAYCVSRAFSVLVDAYPEWVSGEAIKEAAGSEGLRRLRQVKDHGYDYDKRPPPNGRGVWYYRYKPQESTWSPAPMIVTTSGRGRVRDALIQRLANARRDRA